MRIYLLLLFLVFLPSSSFSSFFHFLFFSSFLIRLFFPTYQMTNKRQKDWTIFIELFDSFYLFTRANYFKYYTVTGGSYRCTTILRKIVLLFFFLLPSLDRIFSFFFFFPPLFFLLLLRFVLRLCGSNASFYRRCLVSRIVILVSYARDLSYMYPYVLYYPSEQSRFYSVGELISYKKKILHNCVLEHVSL